MAINFTYWRDGDGTWLGYMNDYPDYWTQGETFEDLTRMLRSLRADIESDPEMAVNRRDQGVLQFA